MAERPDDSVETTRLDRAVPVATDGPTFEFWTKDGAREVSREEFFDTDGESRPPAPESEWTEEWLWEFVKKELIEYGVIPDANGYLKPPLAQSKGEPSKRSVRGDVEWDIDRNLPVYTADLLELARSWTPDGERTLTEIIERFADDIARED